MKLIEMSHGNPPTIRLINQELFDIKLDDVLILRHTPKVYQLLIIVDKNRINIKVEYYNISKSLRQLLIDITINKDTLEKSLVCNFRKGS